jgi:hypothetical protein
MPACGYPTAKGTPCRWERDECRHHRGLWLSDDVTVGAADSLSLPAAAASAIEDHRLHALGWWLIEAVVGGSIDRDRAASVVSIMRVLVSLGDEPPSDDDTRKEALLRAQLAFGMPPRDEAEWEVAERLLDPETLREVHRQVDEADRRIASMRSEVGDRHDRG